MSSWSVVALLTLAGAASTGAAQEEIVIDARSDGRTFEGLGALSAGASSRLLMEYPEPHRARILDFLFKPMFGASLHHLKVEIGGDINSTDGIEPSHARTRGEFENPRPEHYDRGYEWWLMREARKRNPQVFLDILQWGAPAWIGDRNVPDGGIDPNTLPWEEAHKRNAKKFYTQDNADFIVAFIRGAKKHHGLDINFCGIWNETAFDTEWIKRLRRTLDAAGLRGVEIVAADQCGRYPWEIAKPMLKDKTLADAIAVIGGHYPGMLRKDEKGDDHYDTIPEAKQTGKRLWSSEDGPWRGDWPGACTLAKIFTRNYVRGKMTKTVIWSLITSYYENLPLPNSGPMKANTPWSGHYEVQPALWAIAHTTQFAQPGWKYLDGACGFLAGEGSYVTLHAGTANGDYSVVLETVDAKALQAVTFRIGEGVSSRPLHVWRSSERSQFERLADIPVVEGRFTITLQPGFIYSLTTTEGQQKGDAEIPPPAEFPTPYADDFEASAPGGMPKYLSDQGGLFEVAARPDGKGKCLRQVIARKGVEWPGHPTPEPYTVAGATKWRNCEVQCDVLVEKAGCAAIFGRVRRCPQKAAPPQAYWLKVSTDGRWELNAAERTLASGDVAFAADRWHTLKLRLAGPEITAFVDGRERKTVRDLTFGGGMAGLGTGWNHAQFDNLRVEPLAGSPWTNLAEGRPATASSRWGEEYDARFATDGDANTRWNSADGTAAGEWLEIDFGQAVRFNHVIVRQFAGRITKHRIQYRQGCAWRDAFSGNRKNEDSWSDAFAPVQSSRMRFVVDATQGGTPSIYEIEVYDGADTDRPSK